MGVESLLLTSQHDPYGKYIAIFLFCSIIAQASLDGSYSHLRADVRINGRRAGLYH